MKLTGRRGMRDLFLILLGFVYLVAFTSVFLQAAALFGVNGLEPIEKIEGSVIGIPSAVVWRLRPDAVSPDQWFDLVAGAGMFFSLLVMCGLCYAPLLCVCWLLYLSILLVGQTFLSFQWDIFLLEVGGLAILYAPLSPLTAKREPSAVIIMCLNWCLFKIMLMSGVVKVQARCPTWMKLTALHYHYATQCIPTPLSWYAHQLPNFIQKFSVLGTLLIEIPGAFLIIAPWREARVCAAYLNILLMLVILLTGNYTFFNVLTAALCLPLLEEPPAPWASAATHLAAESSTHDTEHTKREEDEEELVEEGIRNGLSKCKEILQCIPAAEEHEQRRQAAEAAKELHNPSSLLHSEEHSRRLRAVDTPSFSRSNSSSAYKSPLTQGREPHTLAKRQQLQQPPPLLHLVDALVRWGAAIGFLVASAMYLFEFSVRTDSVGGGGAKEEEEQARACGVRRRRVARGAGASSPLPHVCGMRRNTS